MFTEVEKTERDYTNQQDQAFILDPLVSHCVFLMITYGYVLDCFKSIIGQKLGSFSFTTAEEFSQCN